MQIYLNLKMCSLGSDASCKLQSYLLLIKCSGVLV